LKTETLHKKRLQNLVPDKMSLGSQIVLAKPGWERGATCYKCDTNAQGTFRSWDQNCWSMWKM